MIYNTLYSYYEFKISESQNLTQLSKASHRLLKHINVTQHNIVKLASRKILIQYFVQAA